MTFDPLTEIRFRGRRLADLSREEMLEALTQALKFLHQLNQPYFGAFEPTKSETTARRPQ